MFNIKPGRIDTKSPLGKTEASIIYPYKKRGQDNQWVIKKIFAQDFDNVLKCMNEITLNLDCSHPSILPINSYSVELANPTGWNIYIKLPRMQENLSDLMDKRRASGNFFTEKELVIYFHTLVSGLEHLHNKKVVHGKLSSTNILVDKDYQIKLTDIGGAKFVGGEEHSYFVVERPRDSPYAAPETLADNPQMRRKDLYKTDAWSLGVIMTELCTLQSEFLDASLPGSEKENVLEMLVREMKRNYSKILLDLIVSLCKDNTKIRKTVGEVKKALEENYKDILVHFKIESDINIFKGIKAVEYKKDSLQFPDLIPRAWQKELREQKRENHVFEERKLVEPKELGRNNDVKIMNDRKTVKRELESIWKDTFAFDFKKGLEVKGKDKQKVDDKSIKGVIEQIELNYKLQKRKALESFSFNLSNCNQITDGGLYELAAGFHSQFENLSSLKLHFANCGLITDNGVIELVNKFGSRLKRLQDICLDFSGCNLLTDRVIEEIGSQFRTNLINMKDIELDFGRCNNITEQGIKTLISYIAGENKISQNSSFMSKLFWNDSKKETIKPLNIQHILLRFSGSKNICEETKSFARESLKFIPQVHLKWL